VLLLGPRAGKYNEAGRPRAIPGHSMPLATIGLFALWLGWFGFNGGSLRNAHPELLGLVVTNTALAGAAGGLAAMLLTPLLVRKPDLSMAINGVLAGLVGVTGCADIVLPHHAIAAGAIGGVICVLAVLLLDKLHLDDPIGAIPVHACGGLWGTLAPAVFANANWQWQALGAFAYAAAAFAFSFTVLGLLKVTIGIRVSPETEAVGLDIREHGQEAYGTEPVTQP
jgi:Amt family ammonium transporter